MHFTDVPEKFVFDLVQLWQLCPFRIPGQVKKIIHPGVGFVRVLIRLVYPNGEPVQDVYSRDLLGMREGDKIIFEKGVNSEKLKEQPDAIQAINCKLADRDEIDRLRNQYNDCFGTVIQEQLKKHLKDLEQERRRVVTTIEERVEEELTKRRLELNQRETDLQQKEKALEQRYKELDTARSIFDAEGGQIFLQYLQTNGIKIAEEERVLPIEPSSERLNITNLSKQLKQSGYDIDEDLLEQAIISMIAAWSSGQFVILAGPTGVGKTQLIKQLSNIVGAGHSITSVRPGWIEPADLLGFYNPTRKLFEPTPVLDRLIEAQKYTEAERFYLLCLDEMNLSRIENYAADLLSQLELIGAGQSAKLALYSREVSRRLYDEEKALLASADTLSPEQVAYHQSLQRQLAYYRPELEVAEGLVLFGTVNIDETTHIFSPKFLDRAYVLRFPPAILPNDLKAPLLKSVNNTSPLWPLSLQKARTLWQDKALPKQAEQIWNEYRHWQADYLNVLGIYLGHRFYASFRRYLAIAVNLLSDPDLHTVAEGYFMAKILPRIRFHTDERALRDQDTKSEIVEEWIEQLQDKSYLYSVLL